MFSSAVCTAMTSLFSTNHL